MGWDEIDEDGNVIEHVETTTTTYVEDIVTETTTASMESMIFIKYTRSLFLPIESL